MNFETLVAALLSTQPSLANKPSNTSGRRASDAGSDRGSPAPSVLSESRGGGHSPRSVGSMRVRRSSSSHLIAEYVRQQRMSVAQLGACFLTERPSVMRPNFARV
jgi:hypothetical protein